MTKETLYRAMGDIDETYITEAYTYTKPKYRALRRWGAVAAVLCLLVGSGLLLNILSGGGFLGNNGGFFGSGDTTVFAAHREDFTPAIDSAVLAQFENPDEVKKAYLMRTNEWFLADDLTDFSQAVTTDTVYVVPGGEKLSDTNADTAYSLYDVDETGAVHWNCSAYPSTDVTLPSGFSGLTYTVIEHTLETLAHEDYIITYAPRMSTVFVWVRGTAEGDVILADPTRPDLLGLESGGAYTLDELQCALTDAYHDSNTDFHKADHAYTHHYTHHTDTHHTNTDNGYSLDNHHAEEQYPQKDTSGHHTDRHNNHH